MLANSVEDNPYASPATRKQCFAAKRSGIRIASSVLSIAALAMFVIALLMPAARFQVDWLDGPVSNNVVSGWAFFKGSFLILMPVAIPFCVANVLIIFASLTLPWCTSLDRLFLRCFLLCLAFLLACFESVTNHRSWGHHLWAGSFLVAVLAHIGAIADTLKTRTTEQSIRHTSPKEHTTI